MGQQQSQENDPNIAISPGGTTHITSPRSHPTTISSLNPSNSQQMHDAALRQQQILALQLQQQQQLPPLQPAPHQLSHSQDSQHQQPTSNPIGPSTTQSPPFITPIDAQVSSTHPHSSPVSSQQFQLTQLQQSPAHSQQHQLQQQQSLQVLPHQQLQPQQQQAHHLHQQPSPSTLTSTVRDLIDESGAATPSHAHQQIPVLSAQVETVPTAFRWTHGGSEVFVTGSFNNWQG